MACARCDFYLPKPSSEAQLLEAKDGLQRMLVEIPLTDDERAAVEGDQTAVDRLLDRAGRHADTGRPDTPRDRRGQDRSLTPRRWTVRGDVAAGLLARSATTDQAADSSVVPSREIASRIACNIDAERRQHARRLLIVSQRREEIAETELRPTVADGAAAGSRHQPADDRVRRDDPGLRLGRLRYLGTRLDRRRQQRQHCCADRGLVRAQADENLHRDPVAVVRQAEENVPGSDVPMPETQRLAQRQLQHLLRSRRERDLTLGRPITGRDDLEHPLTRSISRHPKRVQRPAGVAVGIGEQAEQLMLGPDMGMPELPGRLLRVANNLAGGLCEPFEHERQASHHSRGLTSGAATEETILGQRARMPWVPPCGTRRGLPAPSVADRRTGASRSLRSLPLAHGLGSASGRSAGVSGSRQPPDPHKEGTKDERLSSRS